MQHNKIVFLQCAEIQWEYGQNSTFSAQGPVAKLLLVLLHKISFQVPTCYLSPILYLQFLCLASVILVII